MLGFLKTNNNKNKNNYLVYKRIGLNLRPPERLFPLRFSERFAKILLHYHSEVYRRILRTDYPKEEKIKNFFPFLNISLDINS